MTTHAGLESYLNWLLNHSLEAGVLVLLVLLVQWLFRRQLTSRWRFALWWIVLARLLLPFSPESPMSLFNVFQPKVGLEGPRYSVAVQPLAPASIASAPMAPPAVPRTQNAVRRVEDGPATVPGTVGRECSDQDQRAPSVSVPVLNSTAIAPHSLRLEDLLMRGLVGLWLVGVLVLIGVVATQLIRFNRKLAMASSPADHNLQKLFDECQQEFGLSGRIELLEADAVQSPALFGLLRLRLLLPRGIGGQFAERELRYIFLHELAHVKRGDLWLNWLVTALQIVHWFNPLLWLGFARLRADRELACDELALLRAGDEAGNAYGETVVKLLEHLNRPAAIPGLVGILEDRQQMRRRISMIVAFHRPSRWSVLAVFLIGAVAVAALTDPRSDGPRRSSLFAASGQSYSAYQRGLHNLFVLTNEIYLSYSGDWLVSGRVWDCETKQPVKRFRGWSTGEVPLNGIRVFEGTNGAYLARLHQYVERQTITMQAKGYLLERKELQKELLLYGPTNVDFALKKCSRLAGIVVMPDGRPAAGATVVLLDDSDDRVGLTTAGQLTSYGNRSIWCIADKDGKFVFEPVWRVKSVAAASSAGFAFVGLETFATNSTIKLEPFGRIIGTLRGASGSSSDEQLSLAFADLEKPGLERISLSDLPTADSQGHFNFDRVPAGHLRIWCSELPRDSQKWSSRPLQDVDLKPGETLDVKIAAAERTGTKVVTPYPQPQVRPVGGDEVKGVVLLPDGRPAVGADVALRGEGRYPCLGKGAFTYGKGESSSKGLREGGLLVSAGQDGGFTLRMHEGAKAVVALNKEGFARVSLEQLKASPQITLEKWGRIEGALRIRRRAGTNEQVAVYSAAFGQAPFYDPRVFQVRTDQQGRFVMPFVPPGRHIIALLLRAGEHRWEVNQLATVDVKPGETTVTNVGLIGYAVVGKVRIPEGAAPGFQDGMLVLAPRKLSILEKSQQPINGAERNVLFQPLEVEMAYEDHWTVSTLLSPDGSFRAEDLLPGQYEVRFQQGRPDEKSHGRSMFKSAQELIVPEAVEKGDDSPVDWGVVELVKHSIPAP